MITRRAATAGIATTLIGLAGRAAAQSTQASPESPTGSGKGHLAARPTPQRLQPDAARDAEVWAFNGALDEATRIKHGQELAFILKNETSLPLSLHCHGVRAPNAMDGAGGLTQEPVLPGKDHEYRFTPPDPGTFLIRPCVLGGSAEPTERGLTRMLIVEEASPPQVDQDIALLIDDWALADDGSLVLSQPTPAGRLGSFLTINGKATPQPIKARPGGRLRLRLANACNARIMRLRFDGLKAYVITVDGQPSATFEPLKATLPFAPGNRYDLLVDLPPEGGQTGTVMAMIGNGFPLVEIMTEGDRREPLPDITPLPPNPKLPEIIRLQNATRKDVTIKGDPGTKSPWGINGAAGDVSTPLVKVKRGTPVVLTLKNETTFVQPMHLHGHSFRLLHALDDGWEPYWLDTLQVAENKTVRIAFVADNPGKWLLASTVAERFDADLWSWIEVT
ncbi:multicopper oxidase family protein [Microvirga guangxiensis]|uniref:Multicopper oxidase with three cupredoxin domains (Includes cell division protein FtsP and spore coat protein CotA) n=1 Tax=Microvirga guangxiensis TaxID=549386 RepID=A0A1G5IU03_9HYPH|nr:multicopper oxidase family protein [Microvirga guangxiensis]SCY79211.1 Multicopper oxidase with three cupredoxin domains (includes cell division protein FtsP and spore coat protein CotA) [Microvirga guangxiensis]